MSELFPYRETEVTTGNWLAIRDEEGFASSGAGVEKIADRENVSICNVGDVDPVAEVSTGADNEGRLAAFNAAVEYCHDNWLVGPEDGCWAEGAGEEVGGIGCENKVLCCRLKS
jgi:hypothetical protein